MEKVISIFPTEYHRMKAEKRLLFVTVKHIQYRLANGASGATRRSLNRQLDEVLDKLYSIGGN